MITDILIIVVSVAAVLYGADRLTEGAVSVARRMKISELVVGITVVAFGTSMPELCVSLTSNIDGLGGMAVGNLMGSSVFNALLIVGAASVICPMTLNKKTVYVDMPVVAVASVLFMLIAIGNVVNKLEGTILFTLFIMYMTYLIRQAKTDKSQDISKEITQNISLDKSTEMQSIPKSLVCIVIGLILLVMGSDYFVEAATRIAMALGMSEAVIGLTIVAGGTSLPELATSCVAARKGQSSIAIGNVIGSNVFNILLITGLTSIVSPLIIVGISSIDYIMLIGSAVLLWIFSFTQMRITRTEGLVLLAIFFAYMAWLVHVTI